MNFNFTLNLKVIKLNTEWIDLGFENTCQSIEMNEINQIWKSNKPSCEFSEFRPMLVWHFGRES